MLSISHLFLQGLLSSWLLLFDTWGVFGLDFTSLYY